MKLLSAKETHSLSKAIAELLVKESQAAIASKGSFSVAFSGGSLPKIVADGIVDLDLDCSKWLVLYADERCVPHSHEDSNHKGVVDALFSKLKKPPTHIIAINESLVGDADKAAEDYEHQLKKAVPSLEIDVVFLGMGPDGHTCSLFPGHALLKEAKKLVAGIKDSPKPPPSRITLTYPVLNAAKNVVFVVTGDSKKQVIHDIFVKKAEYPAGLVKPNGNLIWFMDDAASSLLPAGLVTSINDN